VYLLKTTLNTELFLTTARHGDACNRSLRRTTCVSKGGYWSFTRFSSGAICRPQSSVLSSAFRDTGIIVYGVIDHKYIFCEIWCSCYGILQKCSVVTH